MNTVLDILSDLVDAFIQSLTTVWMLRMAVKPLPLAVLLPCSTD